MYRGHLARRVHWEALWERLTKLRSHRLLTKRIQNMEETINKLAYESKSTSEAVKTISKAWRAHRLNTVIDNRIEIKKKRKLSIEKNQTEVAKSKKSKKGHKKVGHTPHSKQDKRPSFVNLSNIVCYINAYILTFYFSLNNRYRYNVISKFKIYKTKIDQKQMCTTCIIIIIFCRMINIFNKKRSRCGLQDKQSMTWLDLDNMNSYKHSLL